ncbi:MAG TPA: hypothetical protein PK453_07385 [Leptospiraceae bacterium]|nr:hypothetical protein [Leptospiraceae bacterium]HNF13474.1 hypothetical protein [Leptospiraceae bacterium]HNF24240.1 hypothetical protein [Leptospiraceae bacterium]HNI96254.1 hypothetical protein [Leptospiraceae bacterium]HNM04095.1 hypothetical protein [Leptospiraceae bacterium]
MKRVILCADVYRPELHLDLSFQQEWDSPESIEFLKTAVQSAGIECEIIEPVKERGRLLRLLAEVAPEQKKNLILWNLTEGFLSRNREAYIPALAEFLGFPYTGADAYAQILSLDKLLSKELAGKAGIPVTAHSEILPREFIVSVPEFPVFLKPRYEGSSLGVSENSICRNWEELYINTGRISEDLFPLLAETYLEGREFTAGFIGERIGAPLEVISPSPVYSEEVKGKSSMPEKLIPVEDASIDNTIMMYTRRIIETLGVRCYGRVDWKLNGNGSLFFLEINLTPGLSPYYSSFPRSYENRLGSYSDMVKEILLLADANYELRQARYGKL